ncbi:MAG: DUF1819 family protein [Candidatus Marinimicrobia bacterium]|nr:DUF1819 family protein [Candidatus Neomarinimicrobiota bacterium]
MFNTQTNVISSVPDFNIILKVLSDYSKGKPLQEIRDGMINGNLYGIRTKGSRIRFFTAINSTFLQFKTKDHKELLTAIFESSLKNDSKTFLGYIQMGVNNELFHILTTDVLFKLQMQGRLTIDKSVFVSYIKNLRSDDSNNITWSDETIGTISYKYLTLMKKLGFLSGVKKKEFRNFVPTNEMIVLTIYLIESLGSNYPIFLHNPLSKLFMMSENALIARLRIISMQEYFTISAIGKDLKIELKYDYKEIGDVIRKNN